MAVSLGYSPLNPPDEPTQDQTAQVVHELPHKIQLQGVTIHYAGEPNTTRWWTNCSKRHGHAVGGMYNGNFWASFHVHGPQQVYRAETMVCVLASDMAKEGVEIILDNQRVAKAALKRKGA